MQMPNTVTNFDELPTLFFSIFLFFNIKYEYVRIKKMPKSLEAIAMPVTIEETNSNFSEFEFIALKKRKLAKV